jgi:hypothetical protein
MISETKIRKAIAPLSKALLRGVKPEPIQFEGYILSASGRSNLRMRMGGAPNGGPAWFVSIRAEKVGEYPIEGSPCEVAACLRHRLNKRI